MAKASQPKDKSDAVVVVPGSLTDLAKALREIIAAIRDVGQLVSDGSKLFDNQRARKAATNLSNLEFTPAGSRRHLERIAAGKATPKDFQAIAEKMASTAGDVERSVLALDKYRNRLRETRGMKAANKLDAIIHGPSGKMVIRETLRDIVEMSRGPEPSNDTIQASASQALGYIESLNKNLVELHDLVVKPAK